MKFKQELLEKMFDKDTVDVLLELEKTIQDFWNVDRQSANFLNLMVKTVGAKSALEIGTSNGYSAIWIAKALLETKGKLTTLEFWEKRSNLAIENFKKTGVNDIITVVTGDAVQILADMKEENKYKFDFIFVDANKAEYIDYYRSFDSMLDVGGIIIADNILSHYKKTENYVKTLMNNENYQSQLLNFEAGMLLSR